MSTTNHLSRLSPPESSSLLRLRLREAFPGTKFSVKLSRGTGYGNCHVSWVGGPSTTEVDAVAAAFEGKTFNGMDDSTGYIVARVVDRAGKTVLSGLGYVLTHRTDADSVEGRKARGLEPLRKPARKQRALLAGAIYEGDNGRLLHGRCSGSSATWTGRDISGQRVRRWTAEDFARAAADGWDAKCEHCDLGPDERHDEWTQPGRVSRKLSLLNGGLTIEEV